MLDGVRRDGERRKNGARRHQPDPLTQDRYSPVGPRLRLDQHGNAMHRVAAVALRIPVAGDVRLPVAT